MGKRGRTELYSYNLPKKFLKKKYTDHTYNTYIMMFNWQEGCFGMYSYPK